jgi:MFS family permease
VSLAPTTHLALVNVFVGDIQGGLGPFLATWLAEGAGWGPRQIGAVTTAVGLATLVLNGPAGALVDRSRSPRLLVALACGLILVGTLMLLPARGFWPVLGAQFVAAAGGVLVIPALAGLTLGIVGKAAFPRQQGRNQAFNHVGILAAALLVGFGTRSLGLAVAFWVLAAMALAAIAAVWALPAGAWNRRRSLGWQEEGETDGEVGPIRAVLANRGLLLMAAALCLFNLGNGSMLALMGQRMVAEGRGVTGLDATTWTAIYVVVAQLTMIPVALWAGALADRQGRRRLLLLACAALPVRAVLTAFVSDPAWLILAEVLDGVASAVVGVAVPVIVADLTWGSGRTQTALGTVNAIQGLGGALSGLVGGLLAGWLGWTGAFLALAVPATLAFVLALRLEETAEDVRQRRQERKDARRERRRGKAPARERA